MSKRVFPSSQKAKHAEEAEAFWMERDLDPKKAKAYDEYVKDHERRLRRLEREARGEVVPGDYDMGYDE
jgi:hypothetical protein